MKNQLKIYLLACLTCVLLFSAGCKKCKDCTTTTTTSVNTPTPGYPQTSTSNFEACDDDLKAVDGKTTTATSSYGGITATVTSKTICR